MKSEILTLLREKKDYVSGQELCDRFHVSRTSVWKAVNQLKKEGYQIEAVQKRGYRLVEEQDIYGQNELSSRISTKWVGKPAHFYESVNSTNIVAKTEAENGAPSGTLIVAGRQTAGRGRRGRSWNSPAGSNIYFTLLLKPELVPDKASMLTILMAMAVAEGIRTHIKPEGSKAQNRIGIKWPNDIVISGKKTCGILTEMSVEQDYIQYVVIGVGINVKNQEFPPEIAETATSIEAQFGAGISRCGLIGDIMQAFEKDYELFMEKQNLSNLKEQYDEMLVNRDREVRVLDPQGEFQGVARGIDDFGELLVEKEDQSIVKVYAGEVSVRGIYGYV